MNIKTIIDEFNYFKDMNKYSWKNPNLTAKDDSYTYIKNFFKPIIRGGTLGAITFGIASTIYQSQTGSNEIGILRDTLIGAGTIAAADELIYTTRFVINSWMGKND